MDSYTTPDILRSALLTIDTQNDFTLDSAPAHISGTEAVIPNMVRLLSAYRRRNLPIIHVVRLYQRDGSNAERCRKKRIEQGAGIVAPGSEGAELVAALKPEPSPRLDTHSLLAGRFQTIGTNEYVMYKPRWGAFYATSLEAFLEHHDVDTLVFCGCNYPNCPRTSIYEASERDFRIALATDAVSGLYARGKEEMAAIGVALLTTSHIESMLEATAREG
jgi:nicotinamidase-related amidase